MRLRDCGDTPVTTLLPRRARDIALGLASPLAGRDDTVEAAADFVEKRLVAEPSADQLAPPQRGEGWVVRVPCREDRRSAARGRWSHIGDGASVRAATRVNAEQPSRRARPC